MTAAVIRSLLTALAKLKTAQTRKRPLFARFAARKDRGTAFRYEATASRTCSGMSKFA